MATNSRLLACKVYRKDPNLYAILALRVDPYFHVLAYSLIKLSLKLDSLN
jgi:hypothetical protein